MLKTSRYFHRIFVASIVAVSASAPAWAASDMIVASFAAPSNYPYGAAYNAGTLYVSDSVSMTIFRLDPDTGSVVSSFVPSPKPSGSLMYGLAYADGYLWATTRSPARLFKIGATDGSVVGSYSIAMASASSGLGADANYLYVGNNAVGATQIFKIDQSNASVVSSWPGAKYPDGACVIRHVPTNRNVVLNLGNVDGWVLIYDLDGAWHSGEEFHLDAPCSESYFVGDFAARDDTHIFFVSNYLKYIYEHEINWGGQEGPGVTPASFGKIKALYR